MTWLEVTYKNIYQITSIKDAISQMPMAHWSQYEEGIDKRTVVQGQHRQKQETPSEK
jgi:hypothetical protein